MIELPEPYLPPGQMPVDWDCGYYTADQMREFYNAALEAAADLCFEAEASDDEYVSTRHTIAAAIWSLQK